MSKAWKRCKKWSGYFSKKIVHTTVEILLSLMKLFEEGKNHLPFHPWGNMDIFLNDHQHNIGNIIKLYYIIKNINICNDNY